MDNGLKACEDIRRILGLFIQGEPIDDYYLNDISNDLCDIEEDLNNYAKFMVAYSHACKIIDKIDKHALLQFISVCVKDQDDYELLKKEIMNATNKD